MAVMLTLASAALASFGAASDLSRPLPLEDSMSMLQLQNKPQVAHIPSQQQVKAIENAEQKVFQARTGNTPSNPDVEMAPPPSGTWNDVDKISADAGATQASADPFSIDEANFRFYANGHHRRPTDPPLRSEIVLAQQVLFGKISCPELSCADELYARAGWQALAPMFKDAGIGGMHPASIAKVLDRGKCSETGNADYDSLVESAGAGGAFKELLNNKGLRCHTKLWSVGVVGVEVPDRQHIIDVEAAIDAGKIDYSMKRILSVRLHGGFHEKTTGADGDSTKWGSEVFIAVDVADPKNPVVRPEYTEVYEMPLDHSVKPPAKAPLDETSQALLHTAMAALYLDHATMGTTHGSPMNFLPRYNGRTPDFDGQPLTYIMKHARPFAYLKKDKAYTYGANASEWLMSAELTHFRREAIPIDGHAVSAGAMMSTMPLTFFYAIDRSHQYVNPEQTLIGLDQQPLKSAALTWFGRGLEFDRSSAMSLLFASLAHMKVATRDNPGPLTGTGLESLARAPDAAMYAEVAAILTNAIRKAWGDDEAVPGTGFRPGRIQTATRHGQNLTMPADAVAHSHDMASFINHATHPNFEGNMFMPMGSTRDARNNPDFMAPPSNAQGKPVYAPNGVPPAMGHGHQQHKEDLPYTVDGYAVTYIVGMKWKVLLSFDRSAGLTFWNIRMQLPPTREDPTGKLYPLLFRANLPNFGTDYQQDSLGNLHGNNFLESQYDAATGTDTGSACQGITLPVFKHKGGGGPYLANRFGATHASYSTLGLPGSVDPITGLPMQGFPSFETGMANDVIIKQAICIEEHLMGPTTWHMYAMQHERCMTVSMTGISEAYNMVVKGEFCNTGHMFFGQDLNGKPAVASSIAGIERVNGAYASRGKGAFAHNHIHWGAVALEGLVGGSDGSSVLEVVDEEQDGDSDQYGMSFNHLTRQVDNMADSDKLAMKPELGRFFRLAGKDSDGEEVGGLKILSHMWGKRIRKAKGNVEAGIPEERTYYGNHWWLRDRDIFVVPVNQSCRKRNIMELLSHGDVGQHYDLYRSTRHSQASQKVGDSFAMFSIVKMRHEVPAEELPIQATIRHHGIMVKPHFLQKFNMDILMRYSPGWNRAMESTVVDPEASMYMQGLGYKSEYGGPITTDCFIEGSVRTWKVKGTNISMESQWQHCQARCQSVPGCAYFTYWRKSNNCRVSRPIAVLVKKKNSNVISGPAECIHVQRAK